MFAGVAYVALHRVVVRRKLRIKVRQRSLGPANLSELQSCHWHWVHVACALRLLSRCKHIYLQPIMLFRQSMHSCCTNYIQLLVGLRISPSGLACQPSGADCWQFAGVAAVLRLCAGQLPELPGRVVPAVLVPAVRAVPGALAACFMPCT